MLKNSATRLYIIVALLLLMYGLASLLKIELDPRKTQMPKWNFDGLPLTFGGWTGKPTDLSEEVRASGTECVTNRIYQDDQGRSIGFYGAMFKDPADGVQHSPMNCYRQSGWQRKSVSPETLKLNDNLSIPVRLSLWERKGEKGYEKVFVLYWYQWGEYVLFERWDLGFKVRWGMRNRATYPPIVKVMLHMPINDAEAAKPVILEFAKLVAQWENSPEHRKELGISGP